MFFFKHIEKKQTERVWPPLYGKGFHTRSVYCMGTRNTCKIKFNFIKLHFKEPIKKILKLDVINSPIIFNSLPIIFRCDDPQIRFLPYLQHIPIAIKLLVAQVPRWGCAYTTETIFYLSTDGYIKRRYEIINNIRRYRCGAEK